MIDCDIHVIIGDTEEFLGYVEPAQRDWFRAQGAGLGMPGYDFSHPGGWFRADADPGPHHLPGSSLEAMQAQVLDTFDLAAGILNSDDTILASLMCNPYRAAALARAWNDWVRERWLDGDARLRATIVVPAQDPLAAAAEIRRVAVDERFVGVLLPGGAERPYGEPRYLPILEAAHECGLPLVVHTGGDGMGLAAPSGGAGKPSFYIEWHTLGSACSVMSHLVSLICHGSFDRFPGLRALFIEGGVAWLPGIMWRLDTNWRGLRDDVPWVRRLPSEVVHEAVRFSTQPLEHTDGHDDLLWEMLSAVGAPGILVFSSDYPHWDFDDPAFMLKRLPTAWREPVMHRNAADLFGARLGLVPA